MTVLAPAVSQGEGPGETRARSVSLFSFTLRLTEPGGVLIPAEQSGDSPADGEDRVHAVLDRGPRGVHLPGTSLAGALRAMTAREWPQRADDLFGTLLPAGSSADDVDAVASRIWVLGARRDGDDETISRSSTKISRQRAAAESSTLRTEELLPAGTRFTVFLRWDDAGEADVERFAALLAAWRPFIGRGISRGRGACVAEDVRHGTLHLSEPADLLRWLTANGPGLVAGTVGPPVPGLDGFPAGGLEPLVLARAEIKGPFHTGNGDKPPSGSREPIRFLRAGGVPVVPGSGLKGLLRSRSEYILRSVGIVACADQRCAHLDPCWPCRVFGRGGGKDEDAAAVGARSLIRVPDALVRDWAGGSRTHIAIDRFTGGVLPGALYTMETLEAGWFDLRVEPLEPVAEPLLAEIRAVLRLVLEDLGDGIIGVGGGIARGYGTVSLPGLDAAGLPPLPEAQATLRRMAAADEH